MAAQTLGMPGLRGRIPLTLRAIVKGLAVGLLAANVWPLLLIHFGVPKAAAAELVFFAVYIWWASGGGPPQSTASARTESFRSVPLTAAQWLWGLAAALAIAIAVHAAMVVLFRLVPFPAADFRQGYDFSLIPTLPLKWLAIVISAASAGICEETGFRGYMQRPLEIHRGAPYAILISSLLFTLLHLNKGWATAGMIPIVFGAGLLYGSLAWSARSLVPGMVGHTVMDIGLFAYWWTGVAGTFTAPTIAQSGIDRPFGIAAAILVGSVAASCFAMMRLHKLRNG